MEEEAVEEEVQLQDKRQLEEVEEKLERKAELAFDHEQTKLSEN